MTVKYKVVLNTDEREMLEQITSTGKHSVRKLKRAQILLMSASVANQNEDIVEHLSVSESTVYRTQRDFVEYGMDTALNEGSRSGRPRKLDASQEALLIASACTKAPKGRSRWTLTLLSEQWMFDVETAREKFNKAYGAIIKQNE